MKKLFIYGVACAASVSLLGSACSSRPAADHAWLKQAIETSVFQLKHTTAEIGDSVLLPRSIWTGHDVDFVRRQLGKTAMTTQDSARLKQPKDTIGNRRYCASIYDWTSGFFPGNLWLAYQLSGDKELQNKAVQFTNYLYPLREYTGTHDIGFMMNCSYGNAYRTCPTDSARAALIQTADNLCGRFNPQIGCIRSWNFGKWNFPVIIDNMMNLDLLFYVSHLTGDNRYKELALTHARTTLKHHFRPDYSSYHVISYNSDGTVESKGTHQGQNDASTWARGQAWGLYGYTSCYRESKDTAFLEQARHIAALIMNGVQTEDKIPLWDYDAPQLPETPRDASAASVTASALLELSTLVEDGKIYADYAEQLLKSLSSKAYLAEKGTNQGFILMHSTGALPNGSEIDTPLNYADYYYLEALLRYMQLKGITYQNI